MRLSWRWLSEMADLQGLDPEEGARLLSFRAADVESIDRVGGALDAVVTARVVKVEPHPGADRLRLCTVEYGAAAPLRVVCGAPNVAEGQTVCFAPVGTTLPNGVTLKKAKIRGVESEGMICAEDELGLGTAHDGIVVLPESTPVGVPVSLAMGLSDVVLDVANSGITSRPDLWGHAGFAREMAAIFGRRLSLPGTSAAEAAVGKATGKPFPVAVADPVDCRRYVAVVVEGIRNGPSPEPLRRRLEALGQRSVDLVVDLTNLAMLEQGQPLHAFDLRDVASGIQVRRAKAGERLTFLDGKERDLSPEDLVIASGDRVLALAGVMGGEGSGVRPDTTAILLEAACFDASRVRRAAIRHGLRTEASSRFEKSLDPEAAKAAALRFLEMLLASSPGARVARPPTDVAGKPYPPVVIDLPFDLVRRRLGLDDDALPDAEIVSRLASVGFSGSPIPGGARVRVPTWRATKDVSIPEDLVEEVGRLHGYEHVLPRPPLLASVPGRPTPDRALERLGRATASLDLGYSEITSYAFHGTAEAQALGLDPASLLRVTNPQSAEQDRLQATCVQNLLRAAAKNQPREPSLRLAEWTRVWRRGAGGNGAHEEIPVAGLLRAERDAKDEPAGAVFVGVVEDALAVLRRMGVPGVRVRPTGPVTGASLETVWAHPGRVTVLESGGVAIGLVAEVHPRVVRAFGLSGRVAAAEIDLARVLAANPRDPRYAPPPRFPTSTFDVAVVVPARAPAAEVGDAIRGSAREAVRSVRLFDAYAGKGIPEGSKSLAFTVEFGAEDGTLSPKTLEALQRRVVGSLEHKGWTVRGGEPRSGTPPA